MDRQNATTQSDYSTDNLQQLASTGVDVGCFPPPLECSHTLSNMRPGLTELSPGGHVK
jgi:hypothetical protein